MTFDPTTIAIIALTGVAIYQHFQITDLNGAVDEIIDGHNRFVDAVVEAAEMGDEDQ
jgi:hypothetical protein